MTTLYTATATSTGSGRGGRAESDDGVPARCPYSRAIRGNVDVEPRVA